MRKLIPFNVPPTGGKELEFISETIANRKISGDGPFGRKAEDLIETKLGCYKALLTTSCTHALEMAAILLDLAPGDEVIVPSYTFVTSALAFVMHGAKIVFCDVRPDTLNLDETKLKALITKRTKAVVIVHYAGVACEMNKILELTRKNDLVLIEDNAHGLFGKYEGRYLGTFGALATQSFHETKNFSCGEGGALLINDPEFAQRAEIIREKGTNRARFFRGEIDKYSWVDRGSSYVLSDILAAHLYAQLLEADTVQSQRKEVWSRYNAGLADWAKNNNVQLPSIPNNCDQAYHMFYLILPDLNTRTRLIAHLKSNDVTAVFHYLPLHRSEFINSNNNNNFDCPISDDMSDRLLRLPFYKDLLPEDQEYVISKIRVFK